MDTTPWHSPTAHGTEDVDPRYQPIQPSTNLFLDYLTQKMPRKLQAAQRIDSIITGPEPPQSLVGNTYAPALLSTKRQVVNLASTVSRIAWKGEHSKHVDTCPSIQVAQECISIKKLLSIRYTLGKAIEHLSSPLPYPSQQVPTY